MIGTCDICERKKVDLNRAFVSGIETYYCDRCAEGKTDAAYRRTETAREDRLNSKEGK